MTSKDDYNLLTSLCWKITMVPHNKAPEKEERERLVREGNGMMLIDLMFERKQVAGFWKGRKR